MGCGTQTLEDTVTKEKQQEKETKMEENKTSHTKNRKREVVQF